MARIIVIDDDPDARWVLQNMLEKAGHSVVLAANGAEGLRLRHAQPIDIVVTDIFMPEMEGLETIQELRAIDRNLGIIAISGGGRTLSAAGSLQTARDLGAEILTKPFESAALLAAIDKVLKRAVC